MSESAETLVTISYRKDGKTYLASMPSAHAEWAEEMLNTDREAVERAAAEKAWDSGYTCGFYDREKLSGDSRDASEGSTENPYRAEAYRQERGEHGNES